MLFKNVAAILELNCLAVQLRKDKISFLSWFNSVDNVVCRYCCIWFFCAAVLLINFFFSLSITLYTVYHWRWWIKLIKAYFDWEVWQTDRQTDSHTFLQRMLHLTKLCGHILKTNFDRWPIRQYNVNIQRFEHDMVLVRSTWQGRHGA